MTILRAAAFTGICLATAATPALAQSGWIDFTNQTSARLTLTQVGMNDGVEKDLAAADLDKDGLTDLIIVRKIPFSTPGALVDVLLMNENGVLTDRTAELAPGFISDPTDARDVVIADLNGDGWDDVLIVNTFNDQPRLYINRGNDGQGNWLGLADESAARLPTIGPLRNQGPGPQFCAAAVGDVTGDGSPDIFFSNYNQFEEGSTEDVLLINNGAGVFTDDTDARLGNRRFSAFNTGSILADATGDGSLDIIKISTLFPVSPWNSVGVFVLPNGGSGDFTASNVIRLDSDNPYMVVAGHFDGDATTDFYVVDDQEDSVHIATFVGGALAYTRDQIPAPRTTGLGGNVKQADLDGDGDPDVGVGPVDTDIANCSGQFAEQFSLLRNDGAGGFDDPFPVGDPIDLRPHDFEFMDVNGDGALDIVMGLCTGWAVLIQDAPAAPCTADLNEDQTVDGVDLLILLSAWGAGASDADLNADGVVDGVDLLVMLSAWGACG